MDVNDDPDQSVANVEITHVQCKHCSSSVTVGDLVEHYFREHAGVNYWVFSAASTGRPIKIVSCPCCGRQLNLIELETHLNNNHKVQETLRAIYPGALAPLRKPAEIPSQTKTLKKDKKTVKRTGTPKQSKIPFPSGPIIDESGTLISFDLWKESLEIEEGTREFGVSIKDNVKSSKNTFEKIVEEARSVEDRQIRRKRGKAEKRTDKQLVPCTLCTLELPLDKVIPHWLELHANKNPYVKVIKAYISEDPNGFTLVTKLFNQIGKFDPDFYLNVIGKMSRKGKGIYDPSVLKKSFSKASGKYCPNCNAIIILNQIKDHFLMMHYQQIHPGKLVKHKNRNKMKVDEVNDEVSKEQYIQSVNETRDGSKLYAHRYRENGSFGSHPVHDNYDDESDAD